MYSRGLFLDVIPSFNRAVFCISGNMSNMKFTPSIKCLFFLFFQTCVNSTT